jgi:16S rRNA (guanine1516-N2)-methyltransferase
MPLKLVNRPQSSSLDSDILFLSEFCQRQNIDITLEWINGQYWLHSDNPKENPIGVEIDRELVRHEEFFKQSSTQKDLVAKSIGIKGAYRPKVLDMTAGLLGDTLLFLSFGCEVIAIERNPAVALVLKSALANAQHPALNKLQFVNSDAGTFLNQRPEVDVLYFDPMFEDTNEKASPRKEMRIFRSLLGQDLDAKSVFLKALDFGARRLVIKRPRLSVALKEPVDIVYEGKATRYDVYLGQNRGPNGSNPLK